MFLDSLTLMFLTGKRQSVPGLFNGKRQSDCSWTLNAHVRQVGKTVWLFLDSTLTFLREEKTSLIVPGLLPRSHLLLSNQDDTKFLESQAAV